MAADFMGRRELFRSSLLVLAIATLGFYWWCKPVSRSLKVNSADTYLNQREAMLYYHGQPFSGAVYSLYPNGDIAKIAHYADGLQEGTTTIWYPGRKLAQQRWFADGKKEGINRGWWPNGKLKFEYHFSDGEYNGEVTEWNPNGTLYRRFHYLNGHEEGRQQMWWDDGSIRANYVIVDGLKYGLTGQKLCRNTLLKAN
jgi:antitoxin component YwqK of YwqJK toxin-antitoxin module